MHTLLEAGTGGKIGGRRFGVESQLNIAPVCRFKPHTGQIRTRIHSHHPGFAAHAVNRIKHRRTRGAWIALYAGNRGRNIAVDTYRTGGRSDLGGHARLSRADEYCFTDHGTNAGGRRSRIDRSHFGNGTGGGIGRRGTRIVQRRGGRQVDPVNRHIVDAHRIECAKTAAYRQRCGIGGGPVRTGCGEGEGAGALGQRRIGKGDHLIGVGQSKIDAAAIVKREHRRTARRSAKGDGEAARLGQSAAATRSESARVAGAHRPRGVSNGTQKLVVRGDPLHRNRPQGLASRTVQNRKTIPLGVIGNTYDFFFQLLELKIKITARSRTRRRRGRGVGCGEPGCGQHGRSIPAHGNAAAVGAGQLHRRT